MNEVFIAIIAAIVPVLIFYLQRGKDKGRDDASLAGKYQEIATIEANHRIELEKRFNVKFSIIQAELEAVTRDRDRWRKIAQEQAAIIEQYKGAKRWD